MSIKPSIEDLQKFRMSLKKHIESIEKQNKVLRKKQILLESIAEKLRLHELKVGRQLNSLYKKENPHLQKIEVSIQNRNEKIDLFLN